MDERVITELRQCVIDAATNYARAWRVMDAEFPTIDGIPAPTALSSAHAELVFDAHAVILRAVAAYEEATK